MTQLPLGIVTNQCNRAVIQQQPEVLVERKQHAYESRREFQLELLKRLLLLYHLQCVEIPTTQLLCADSAEIQRLVSQNINHLLNHNHLYDGLVYVQKRGVHLLNHWALVHLQVVRDMLPAYVHGLRSVSYSNVLGGARSHHCSPSSSKKLRSLIYLTDHAAEQLLVGVISKAI